CAVAVGGGRVGGGIFEAAARHNDGWRLPAGLAVGADRQHGPFGAFAYQGDVGGDTAGGDQRDLVAGQDTLVAGDLVDAAEGEPVPVRDAEVELGVADVELGGARIVRIGGGERADLVAVEVEAVGGAVPADGRVITDVGRERAGSGDLLQRAARREPALERRRLCVGVPDDPPADVERPGHVHRPATADQGFGAGGERRQPRFEEDGDGAEVGADGAEVDERIGARQRRVDVVDGVVEGGAGELAAADGRLVVVELDGAVIGRRDLGVLEAVQGGPVRGCPAG